MAAKTGTTQSRIPGQNNDAWTVGYTPSISAAVWVGTDDNSPIVTSGGSPIYGRMVPGQIWQQFMNTALRNTPAEQFSKFVPLGTPPSGNSSDTSDDSDNEDDSGHHRHNNGDGSNNDDCGLFSCDGNGDSLLGGGHHRHNSDQSDNGDSGDN